MSNWTASDIPDQNGRITIVTGANSGIGLETARELARKGAKTILAVRDRDKGDVAAEDIHSEIPNSDIEVWILDLSSLQSVKDFAEKFKKEYDHLDLLINNAGVMMPPYSKTADGYELQFGTNHLGHFALTAHLFDLLQKTKGSRVVNVSSMAHNWGKVNFDDLNSEKNYNRQEAYGQSKLANLYFTFEMQRRLKRAGKSSPIVTAAHPGWTATNLQKHNKLFQILNPFFSQKPPMGALPTLRAAIDSEARGSEYYGPKGFKEIKGYPVKVDSNKLSKDETIAKQLWVVSEKVTGVEFKIE
ncbi:SDR family NAD(P)-dependent oxidoreductase [bacterium]|nr:SDR family NAD(P)-dependent oxidoreductase [bacterium]